MKNNNNSTNLIKNNVNYVSKAKLISTLLTFALIFSLFATTAFAATATFKDVPATHWANSAVERAYADGAVQGASVAANGEKLYAPNGKLTIAEFITMLTRAFYADELASAPAGSAWYSAAEAVATNHSLFDNVDVNYGDGNGWQQVAMSDKASRYNVAQIMYNILEDKGYSDMPDRSQRLAAHPYDLSIANETKDAVETIVALGVMSGKDAKGTFDGYGDVTRAEAATVYVNLTDLLGGKVLSGSTTQPAANTGNYGPVGTVSDEPVTLSLSTHKPVVDYWADLSDDLKAIIPDKDRFNAAVQTIKDRDIATKDNVYYNFACYDNLSSFGDDYVSVTHAMRGFGYDGGTASNSDSKNVARYYKWQPSEAEAEVFAPIYARFTDDMSDMQKAQIMLDEVNRRFDYGKGDFSWTDGNTTGDCDVFAAAVNRIFRYTGIPCFGYSMTTYLGEHEANAAYLDGKWYVIDATESEYAGREGIMSYERHEQIWQYHEDASDRDRIIYALVDAAYN